MRRKRVVDEKSFYILETMLKGVMGGISSSCIKSQIDIPGSQGANCKAGRVRRGKTYELGQSPVYFTHVVTNLEDYDW